MESGFRHGCSANNWWERSPNSGNSNNFCNVNSDGSANNNNASNTNLLAPCGYPSQGQGSSVSETTVGSRADEREAGCRDLEGAVPRTSAAAPTGACAGGTQGAPGADPMRFEEVFGFDNLLEAAHACCNGVRWKSSTQTFESTLLMRVANLHSQLMAGTWKSKGFNRFTIRERGKVRRIQAVHISERVVQKCLVRNCLRPLIMPKLIAHSFATLPGKGTEAALAQHKEHLRWWYARHKRDGAIVTMDYHDYFASIRHDALKGMCAALPMDSRLYDLTCYLIDCFDGDRGLGLGSEVSQISAVFYTNPIDHLLKDRLGIHCYGRYMDDSYMIAERSTAREALDAVEGISECLGLRLNSKATQVRPLTQGWHYLKKRVQLTETGRVVMRLERDNVRRARRRAEENALAVPLGFMSAESAAASWQSWEAYASRYDAHRTLQSVRAHRDEIAIVSNSCSRTSVSSQHFGLTQKRA